MKDQRPRDITMKDVPDQCQDIPSQTQSRRSLKSGKVLSMGNNFVVKSKDVCRIIKECAKFNVLELSLGDLHLVFDSKDPLNQRTLVIPQTKGSEQAATKISKEAEAKERSESLRQDMEELRLTDPLAFEHLMSEGDIEVGGESHS